MKKCLITGCGGFIGSKLAEYLLQKGVIVYGMAHRDTNRLDDLHGNIHVLEQDILDKKGLERILKDIKPDYIFHLAAQSSIPLSWQEPEETFRVNVLGTLNLLEATRNIDIHPVIEITGSSAEYGPIVNDTKPVKETNTRRPSSPYAVSKMAESELARLYWQNYGLQVLRTRPFYIIGPGRSSGACYEFARRIIDVGSGCLDNVTVGNLNVIRDIVDVRDTVKAIWLIAEKGQAGDVYNICSGKGNSMQIILDKMISISHTPVKVQTVPELLRPLDEPVLVGDCNRLNELGWKPEITLEQTLSDILEYVRKLK